jgi:Ni/Co efflux regulator RcnB
MLLIAAPVAADPPGWAGNGKGKHHSKGKSGGDAQVHHRGHFEKHHHVVVREYYGEQFRGSKKCPPGLAKKNNGCMPPGQAKKWNVGQPLPQEIVYHELPRELVIKLPQPRAGHRYVRVAADILLIAIGTSMVVDAIEDLGRI